MPANTGRRPHHERVDLRLKNGWTARNVDPSKYDWRLAPNCAGIPITHWQRSE